MALEGGNSQQIGGVSFGVSAIGAEQATAQVNQTAGAVQNLGNTAQAAGAKTKAAAGPNGIGAIGASMKEATKDARGFLGGLKSVAAVGLQTFGLFSMAAGILGGLALAMRSGWEWSVKQGKGLKELDERWKKVQEAHEKYSKSTEDLEKLKLAGGGTLPGVVSNLDLEAKKALEDSVAKNTAREADLQAKEVLRIQDVKDAEERVRRAKRGGSPEDIAQQEEMLRLYRSSLKSVSDPLNKLREDRRQLNEFTQRIAKALADAFDKPASDFFKKLGAANTDSFASERIVNGMVSIEDQLSAIMLSQHGREQ